MGQTTTIPLPFDQGLSQQEAVEWLDSGASGSGILNGNFTKALAVDKRLGMSLVAKASSSYVGGPTTSLTSGIRTASWSRCAFAVMGIGSFGDAGLYSTIDNTNLYQSVGPLSSCRTVRRAIPATGVPSSNISTPVLVDIGTTRYIFYVSGTSTYVAAINYVSGDMVSPPVQLASGTAPDAIVATYLPGAASNQNIVVVLQYISTSTITGYYINTSTPGNLSFGSSFTKINVLGLDAAAFVGDPAHGWILFTYTSTNAFTWYYSTAAAGQLATGTLETVAGGVIGQVSATYGVGEFVAFWYSISGTLRFAALTGNGTGFAVTTAPLNGFSTGTGRVVASGIVRTAANTFLASAYWPVTPIGGSSITTPKGVTFSLSGAGTTLLTGTTPQGWLPTAKPFLGASGTVLQAGITFLSLYNNALFSYSAGASYQCTLYLLQYQQLIPQGGTLAIYSSVVSVAAPRQVDPISVFQTYSLYPNTTFQPGPLPAMSSSPGNVAVSRAACGLRTFGSSVPSSGASNGATWSVDYLFDSASQALLYQSAEVSGDLAIAGSVTTLCDAVSVQELGFTYYPEYVQATPGGGTTNLLVGTYVWAVVYVRVDGAGLRTRSAPSFSLPITLTGGATMGPPVVTACAQVMNAAQLFASEETVYAEIYRNSFGGSTFNLVTRVPAAANISFTDTIPDAAVSQASLLYTTGGIEDSVNPPGSTCLIVHKQRLWLVDETLKVIWFSPSFAVGEAPSFNETNTIPWLNGDITGLFSLDDKLLVGTLAGLWVIYGDGPSDTGQGNDLTTPQKIASDSGPVDWRAGCVFPGGLLYRSSTGIMLCDRGLSVSWIGKDIVDTLALFPTVVSSVLVSTATQVRFICQNATGQSTTLCYDYLAGKWLQHSYLQQPSAVADVCMSSSYATVTTDGNMWQEHSASDAHAYLDDDTSGAQHFVPTSVTPAWVKVQGVQGYQRARFAQLFFEELDDCGVTVAFATNYSTTVQQSHTWLSGAVDELPVKSVQLNAAGNIALQMALQVTVSDTQGANITNGRGARFVALNVELEQLDGTYPQIPSGGRA
jgi:hypothetical protein